MAKSKYIPGLTQVIFDVITQTGSDLAGYEAVGISADTFYGWVKRYPEFAQGVDSARERYREFAKTVKQQKREKEQKVAHERYKSNRAGWIYFVVADDVMKVKIGFTVNLRARFADLQCGCPCPLELFLLTPGSMGTEKSFHHRFKQYKTNGEWYEIEGELRDFMASINPEFFRESKKGSRRQKSLSLPDQLSLFVF